MMEEFLGETPAVEVAEGRIPRWHEIKMHVCVIDLIITAGGLGSR